MFQIDYDDPRHQAAAAAVLQRHDNSESEANITSAVRDFLLCTGLVDANEVAEEVSPSDSSGRFVDLTALDTFIEVKKRIGTTDGFNPNENYVRQLDEYLAESMENGQGARMGVLTDGRYWLLRWPNAGEVKTTRPHAFTLESAAGWLPLYEWLRDEALVALDDIPAQRTDVERHFGPSSPSYQRDIAVLNALYQGTKDRETVQVKCRLWENLLQAALGEIAQTDEQLDDLFVRHTYLSMVIGMVVQAYFGMDIRERAANDPTDLLYGRQFRDDTGLQDIIESDFFAWPAEVGGQPLIKTIARRVARFNWKEAPSDIASTLYEAVIPPDERRRLGEYYTPEWLAQAMVQEVVTDPLRQRVLDPSCGSGTFIAVSVRHFVEATAEAQEDPKEALERLREAVIGIDVHPVAVRLARTAWIMAARPLIDAAAEAGYEGNVAIPVYLGDALQLHYQTGDLFISGDIGIEVEGDEFDKRLIFPIGLVEQADTFDLLMSDIADAIERGNDPLVALDDRGIVDPGQRQTLAATIAIMQELHAEGRDHIWAYYTRNLVRPVALSRRKVDVIVGNPPWLNYRNTASVLRDKLVQQSKELYHIWQGGRYATHQDVAGLFFARSVALYLRDGGIIAMVLPHSALQTGQYAKWRTGRWGDLAVNFGYKTAWDLEKLKPNTFFPVASCVAFAERTGENAPATPLAGEVERWQGATGAKDVRRERIAITDTSVSGTSPYAGRFRQGASIVPRCLFFVNEVESTTIVKAAQTVKVGPRRGSNDKAPWKTLDLTAITGQTIEKAHLFDVYLGETVVPYATLTPLKALLPLKQSDDELPVDANGTGGIHLGGLEQRMRGRWQQVSGLWEQHKGANDKKTLLGRLDYHRELSAQLEWHKKDENQPIRVAYTSAGEPTAAIIAESDAIIDYKLFWATCKDEQEAHYVLAIINSRTLYKAAQSLMSKGQFGARDLQKHLWKLSIPEYDATNHLHQKIAMAGQTAASGTIQQLQNLYNQRGDTVSTTVVRRELRGWLAQSDEGKQVETLVKRLLE